MAARQRSDLDLGGYDWAIILLYGGLVFAGWLMIFASKYDASAYEGLLDLNKNYGKQLLWVSVSLVLIVGAQMLDSKFYQTFAVVFYGATLLLLVGVLFTTPINGATSWFEIGGFKFQPSEFAKISTCVALAAMLSAPEMRMQDLRFKIQAIGLIILPMFLILLQGDAGSTLVYGAFFLVLFRAGMDAWLYLVGLAVAALSILSLLFDTTVGLSIALLLVGGFLLLRQWNKTTLFAIGYLFLSLGVVALVIAESYQYAIMAAVALLLIFAALNFSKNWQFSILTVGIVAVSIGYASSVNYIVNNMLGNHRQERIWVWLRPEKCHPLGPLYNVEQSKFAIGSGGWSGKGFLQGERTKLDYVPEQSTDFIFCTVGEEWGFLGSIFIILLFSILIIRVLFVAERQRAAFSKYYAYGVATILFFHVFINVGMTMGLVPVIGIPLPFISYGGSSLISFSILIGILLKLDSNRLLVFR
ncbi:MAG: rod shape-determining protein RodA [Aureispira sp.]|nr:rod shape-determining protein RodA [Aureispira sp.]